MYAPRTGRTPASAKLIAAAVSVTVMGMGGVAVAAPKGEQGPPEHAVHNGQPPEAQNAPPAHAPTPANGPTPAHGVTPEPRGPKGTGGPADVPHDVPARVGGDDNPRSDAGQSGHVGASERTAHQGGSPRGEARGQLRPRSNADGIRVCRSAGCHRGTPARRAAANDGAYEPSKAAGGKARDAAGAVLGLSEKRGGEEQPGRAPGERRTGAPTDSGSVFGLNQGGGEEARAAGGSFDAALPFTGLQLMVMAAVGLALALAGVRLWRWTP